MNAARRGQAACRSEEREGGPAIAISTATLRPNLAVLTAGCMAAVWLSIAPAPGAAETLTEALVQAYRSNPTLRAERARLRATDEGVAQALSNWRPTISIDGDAGWKWRNRTLTGAAKEGDSTLPRGASLSIDQNLYRGGRTLAATRRAENLVRADRARLLSAEQAVLLDAATAYVDVVRDQAVVELNVNNEKVLRRQLEATQDRFRVGEVTRTDVAQAESRLSRAIADRVGAEGALIKSRAAYNNVIGDTPGTLAAAEPVGRLPANENETLSLAGDKSFGVLQADFTERAAKNRIDEVSGELLPTVTVSGELSRDEENINSRSETDTVSVTASLSIPLYQAGGVAARVREAKQTAAQRRGERNQAVRDAVEEATRAWEALATARAQIESFTAGVRAATIALEGVEQEALVGSRTVLDVLDAEQEYLDAQVSLVRVKRDEVVASYRLRKAVGSLTAEALKLPVEYYDFTRYYKRARGKWFGLRVGGE